MLMAPDESRCVFPPLSSFINMSSCVWSMSHKDEGLPVGMSHSHKKTLRISMDDLEVLFGEVNWSPSMYQEWLMKIDPELNAIHTCARAARETKNVVTSRAAWVTACLELPRS